jgi:thiol-disulfide isomerase/thioredoxin
LWIDSETYMLHRMELPIESQRHVLNADNRYSHLKIWIDFEDPVFDAQIDADTYVLDLPAGGRRVRRLVAPPPPGPPEQLGKPIAEFQLTAADGQELTPSSLLGKTVLLDFWALDCAHCKAHTPAMEQVYRALQADGDVAVYGVNINGAEASGQAIDRTFRSWGRTMPVLRDVSRDSFERLQVAGTPTLLLIGADGRLQYISVGAQNDPEGLIELVRRLKEGADLAADARAKHAETVANYEQALADATIEKVSATSQERNGPAGN